MGILLLTLIGSLTLYAGVTDVRSDATRRTPQMQTRRADPTTLSARASAGRAENRWRYVFHQGRWWYWSASERWSYFDGSRWIDLDSLGYPLTDDRDLAQADALRLRAFPREEDLRFRFGELPVPRSRAGSFDFESTAPIAGRNLAGSFEAGAALPHALLAAPGQPAMPLANPYGPDSNYGAYGSTDPFRGGQHVGAGGNFGYGFGAPRPAAAGYGRTYPSNRPQ